LFVPVEELALGDADVGLELSKMPTLASKSFWAPAGAAQRTKIVTAIQARRVTRHR
jgi:hypothetical protein